jgi:peptidoglycan/LPS O-acetylase OafA/YrhL
VREEEVLPWTGLRFVAAFYVFLFHIHIRWPLAALQPVNNFLNAGAVGMSLFFVLSGFVLAHRYHHGPVPCRSYLVNRFARIYPVYFVAALVTVPWMGVSFGAGSSAGAARPVAQLLVLVVANVLLVQAWLPQLFGYWNDGGSWSISAEAFFYVLFPFLLGGLAQRTRRQLAGVLLAAYVLAVLPAASYLAFDPKPNYALFYSMPIFRLPEFVFGVCAYLAARQAGPLARLRWAVLPATALLAAYLALVGPGLPPYVVHNWLALPVIGFVLAVVGTSGGLAARVLSAKPLVWAGRVSYCFYSFQVLLLLVLVSHHDRLVRRLPLLRHNGVLCGASFLVLLAVSGLAHRFLEEPLRRWIRRLDRRPSSRSVARAA